MGVDIQFRSRVPRGAPRGSLHVRRDERVAQLLSRQRFAIILPVAQRGMAVSDAVQGLWFEAGNAYTQHQFDLMTTRLAATLRGSTHSRYLRRSRLGEHIFGPGEHRTHPATALVYRWFHHATRMIALNKLSLAAFTAAWHARGSALGPFKAVRVALTALQITWVSPLSLAAGPITLTIPAAPTLYTAPLETGELPQPAALRDRQAHDLREFLRSAGTRTMALARPKDFEHLRLGMVQDPLYRHQLYSIAHRRCGPALLCGGQWTMAALHQTSPHISKLCLRCSQEPEDLLHRLWHCSANAAYKRRLFSAVPAARVFPAALPAGMARTGVAPAGWNFLTPLQYGFLLDYMWSCSVDATTVSARQYCALPAVPQWEFDSSQAMASLTLPFQGPSAPFRAPRRRRAFVERAQLTHQPAFHQDDFAGFSIFADGSYTPPSRNTVASCGWGFYVCSSIGEVGRYCGPIHLQGDSPPSSFARALSNNVAEVAALHQVLRWLLSQKPGGIT